MNDFRPSTLNMVSASGVDDPGKHLSPSRDDGDEVFCDATIRERPGQHGSDVGRAGYCRLHEQRLR